MQIENLERLVAGEGLTSAEENQVIDLLVKAEPDLIKHICQSFAAQRRATQKQLIEAQIKDRKATDLLAKLKTPPLHPGWVLRVHDKERIDVISDGRRMLVAAMPGLDVSSITAGDEILLDRESGLALSLSGSAERVGVVGVVSEIANGRVLIRGTGDQEFSAVAAPELADELRAGDRVLYTSEYPCVLERLPKRSDSSFILEDTPSVSFADIGGLDGLIDQIRGLLDLHLKHPKLIAKYGLELLRGITLVGSPGVGKTTLAKGLANYLASFQPEGGPKPSFLHVSPGALRGSFYGQTESRIRDLFEVLKQAEGLVVVLFDELDSYGTRGDGFGQDIDGRVIATLLAAMDGLDELGNVLFIGATNRLDRCEGALVRPGRMGDRVFTIPRPGRRATREILARYLDSAVHYADRGSDELADAATHYLHTRTDGAGVVANLTLRNGDSAVVHASDILSGALLSSAVQAAKHRAARREIDTVLSGGASATGTSSAGIDTTQIGLTYEDLLAALDDAINAEAEKIATPHVARQALDIPRADEIERVELAAERRDSRHRYLRVA